MIGRSIPRIDALSKACGQEQYIADMDFPEALEAVTLRSTVPRGKIKSIRFDPQFKWDDFIIITAKNFPGNNVVAMIQSDYPALVLENINFCGEAIALIAGETREKVLTALKHISVEIEPLHPIFTIEESLLLKEIIRKPDNVLARWKIVKGDVEEGIKKSDLVVEGEYRTGTVEHAYLETNGVVAIPLNGGGIKVIGSMQCPYYVKNALKRAFNLPDEKVIVEQAPTGGGFGGKEDFPSVLAVHAVAIALKAHRPVKLLYPRDEDIISSSKRHPSLVRHKTGVMKDGTLLAMQIEFFLDGGAYSTMSPVVLQRGVIHATGPYRCPNVLIEGKALATNHVPRGAFRGFGTPQAIFAIERHMDTIASKLGMDPATIREKNAFRIGDRTSTGQLLKESVSAGLVLDRAMEMTEFKKKWWEGVNLNKYSHCLERNNYNRHVRRGIGLSLYWHGSAFTGGGEMRIKAKAGIRMAEDGKGIEILSSTVEMGQGYQTVISQIAAEALEVDISMIRVAKADTSIVPDSGPTVASRTTMVVGAVVKKACEKMIISLCKFLESDSPQKNAKIVYKSGFFYDENGKLIESLQSACKKYLRSQGQGEFIEEYTLPPGHCWNDETMEGDAYPCYGWGADVVEVEVDMDTFEITPVRVTTVFDAGKAINPQTATGQFEGGTLQALGWGYLEEVKYDSGKPLNENFSTYIIPTASDTPLFQTEIVEIPFSHGPYGAKGIGELPYDGAAPALVSAIENATGLHITEIPVTPELLLEKWTKNLKGKL